MDTAHSYKSRRIFTFLYTEIPHTTAILVNFVLINMYEEHLTFQFVSTKAILEFIARSSSNVYLAK
jgi:hypothetical protein